jgi:phage-related protein
MRTTGKIGGGGGGILSGLFSWIPKLFGFADGTAFAPGGPARVNEVGGEIINLPRGSQVIPHDVSMRMAAAPSASRGSTTLNVNVRVDGARGDQHIVNLVHVGVSRGIQAFQESPEFEMGAARATAKAKRDGSVRGL